jgi:hypothetical protein
MTLSNDLNFRNAPRPITIEAYRIPPLFIQFHASTVFRFSFLGRLAPSARRDENGAFFPLRLTVAT